MIFYKAIAEFAQKNLSNKGRLYFEINEYLGEEMKELVKSLGFREVEVHQDINGRNVITSYSIHYTKLYDA